MLFKLPLFVVLLGVVSLCHAYEYLVPPSSDHPNVCYHETANVTMKPGETYYALKFCERYICSEGFYISAAGCGTIGESEYCKKSDYDYTKEYPDCCPTLICKAPNEIEKN